MFPAVDQYPASCLFTTDFILPSGSPASLFESNCTGIVDTHFRWMQSNSIDGILVQRFYGQFDDPSFLQLLSQIRTAAEKYNRTFAVEYDLSPIQSTSSSTTTTHNMISELQTDYHTNIVPLTTSPAYLHHSSRPVLELWGIGVDKPKLTAADSSAILHLFRSLHPTPYILLGVPWSWATDATSNPDYYALYTQADAIQPWAVGAYSHENYEEFYNQTTVTDKALTDRLGIKYGPSVTPGGSDRNRQGLGEEGPLGNRYNGSFYGAQLEKMLGLKPAFIFGAMFDEFPESKSAFSFSFSCALLSPRVKES